MTADYYEILDRVPREDIDTLTVEAMRVWLERAGAMLRFDSTDTSGIRRTRHQIDHGAKGWSDFGVRDDVDGPRKAQLVEAFATEAHRPVRTVIAEIRAIAEWQKRCAEWVAPKDGEYCDCRECGRFRVGIVACPTCGNKRCPRATDHRNECSGHNMAGQEGSRCA